MKIQTVRIETIQGNKDNPRLVNKSKYEKLKKSIQDFPEMLKLRPLIVNEHNVILGGNMRYKALVELGYKEVPVIKAEDLTERQAQEFIVKDNLSYGDWDFDILANEWDSVELEDWGLDVWQNEDDLIAHEAEEDDYVQPEEMKVDVVLGDLIEIGEHRLLCGDSTDSDQVEKLINGDNIDMVFTDPPYGIDIVGSKGKVGGDNIAKNGVYSNVIGDDTTDTAKNFYNTCISFGMENFIIWGGNYFTEFLPASMCWLIWNKQNTGNFADVEMAWTSYNKAAKLYTWQWNGMIRKGKKDIEGKTRMHPTQKPVGLFNFIFKDFDFNICYDGFLGSGSTMVASHQLKRKCYGMELDPKYCQVIIDRMLNLDNTLEVKINGKPYTK